MKNFLGSLFGFLTVLMIVTLSTGCDYNPNPSAPSVITPGSDNGSGSGTNQDQSLVQADWSPYVVVHPDGSSLIGQRVALQKLAVAGMLKGIRINVGSFGADPGFIDSLVSGTNIDVLGILSNKDLLSDNLEATLDRIYTSEPRVNYFQVGNEFDSPNVNHGMAISVQQYMEIFKRVYAYTAKNHPDIHLVTGATMTGPSGADDLQKMIDLGLTRIDPNMNLIISMNVYNIGEAGAYTSVIPELVGYRIWVTEHGVNDPNQQINYVQNSSPVIKTMLRAERVYWYANWVGDQGKDSGFGLITHPQTKDIVERQLFKALVGDK